MDVLWLVPLAGVIIISSLAISAILYYAGRWVWRRFFEDRLFGTREHHEIIHTNAEQVAITAIPRGGDSLFMAVAHQLHPRAENLKDRARSLRLGTSHHLLYNLEKYWPLLIEALQEHGDRYALLPSVESRILRFLQDLADPDFPAGTESLQALADLLQVDIVVFPEGGDRETVRSSADLVNRTIGVVRRRPAPDVRGPGRFHYDSVHSIAFLADGDDTDEDSPMSSITIVELTNNGNGYGSDQNGTPYIVELVNNN